MFSHFRRYPLFCLILMVAGLAMLVPALYAARLQNFPVMQTFFSSSLLILILGAILGLALMNRRPRISARSHLTTILITYTILPAFLAIPFVIQVPSMGFAQGYFEMLSSLTTTGATIINDPLSIAAPLHLWRAVVAWSGGFMMLVIAFSIMEPMNLGGFEIRSLVSGSGLGDGSYGDVDPSERIVKNVLKLGPVYAIATFALTMLLMMSGDRALTATVHSMSILSTSGISSVDGISNSGSGRLGEAFMAFFLLFALSHRSLQTMTGAMNFRWVKHDVELRLALIILVSVPLLLLSRHWIAAPEISEETAVSFAQSLWGGFFTVLSFMTTTGFESADWQAARLWSGLNSPGIILLALVILGGGVATTAGGIKLLRFYALYRHGLREMERLVHPSSIGGAGMAARRFRREGAFIAWVFLMLFLVGIAVVMLMLSAFGTSFEDSIAFAISSVTNTGPAAHMLDNTVRYSDLNDASRMVLCVGMVFGRVEVLALIALFNPNYWRR